LRSEFVAENVIGVLQSRKHGRGALGREHFKTNLVVHVIDPVWIMSIVLLLEVGMLLYGLCECNPGRSESQEFHAC
jgi:hypothetical protein